jgi:hypothetical protein
VSYRLTNQNYLISFFDPARDGWHWEAAVRQYVLLNEFSQYIFFGYQHDRDLPSLSVGNDFQYHAHQFEVGVRTPLLRDMSTELTYFFRDENYTFANSRTNFTKARSDNTHSLFFLVRKPLTPYLDVTVSYIAMFNDSNIDDFQYDRHIISLGLQLAY